MNNKIHFPDPCQKHPGAREILVDVGSGYHVVTCVECGKEHAAKMREATAALHARFPGMAVTA